MKAEKNTQKLIVMVPYPAQGHVTPMLKFATSLLPFGYRSIIVLPEFLHRQIKEIHNKTLPDEHQILSIPDGIGDDGQKGFFEIEKAMENIMPPHLERIIRALQNGGDTVACLIADVLVSPVFHVATTCGVPAAAFWPAMLATYRLFAAIPDLLHSGIIDATGIPVHNGQISLEQGLPTINTKDLPWLIGSLTERQSKFKFWVRTLNRVKSIQWLLVNSYPNEVEKTKSNLDDNPTIYPIGLPKNDEQIQKQSPISLTFWAEDEGCLDWLNEKKTNSVLYVSFGTWFSPSDKSKVKALALSLEALGRPFLWALGPKWADGLPVGFTERVSDRGKVVAWAPQPQVLNHKAVGCFLTHCGWNSITEAIASKKCLVCSPLGGDQLLNCAYVVDVWKIGVRIEGFGAQEMDHKVNHVMNNIDMKKRILKLNDDFMGEEARLKMMANITYFLNSFNKLAN